MDNDRANIILQTELPPDLGVLEVEALSRTRELYTVLPRILLDTAQPVLLGSRVDGPKNPLLFWDLRAHGVDESRTPYVRRATQYRAEYGAEGLRRNPVPDHHNFFDREKECRLFSRYLLPIQLVSYVDSSRLKHGVWTNTIGHIPIPNELLLADLPTGKFKGASPPSLAVLVSKLLDDGAAARMEGDLRYRDRDTVLKYLLMEGEFGQPYLVSGSNDDYARVAYILRFYPPALVGSRDSSLSILIDQQTPEDCIYAV